MAFVVLLGWFVPIVMVALLFRALGTILDGVRSINATVLRLSDAVDALANDRHRPRNGPR